MSYAVRHKVTQSVRIVTTCDTQTRIISNYHRCLNFYFKAGIKRLMEFAFGSPLYDVRCAKVYLVSDAKGG
jgi:hypothetical protein